MKIHLARLPALTAILLSLASVIADTSSSGSSSSSVRDFKLEGDALLAKGEYLGASRAYSNAIGQSPRSFDRFACSTARSQLIRGIPLSSVAT